MSYIYKKCTLLLVLAVASICYCGCNVINPAEEIPTYVHVDSFEFEGNQLQDIQAIWVYYNNNPIGAFDLPATVPIITSGTGELQITPAIMVNGRNERPSVYPFFKPHISTLEEHPGETITILPKTRYYDSVKIKVISEFEAGSTKFSKWDGTTSLYVVTADSLRYEGTGTGAVYLNSANDFSIDSSSNAFAIPDGIAFIELTYKSSIPFVLGMGSNLKNLYSSGPQYLAGVNPANDKWHKFYLNLTAFISNGSYNGDDYNMYLKTMLETGQENGRLLIDNIKLVTF